MADDDAGRFWFDDRPLRARRSLTRSAVERLGRQGAAGGGDPSSAAIAAFARANGLDYRERSGAEGALPSLVVTGARDDVVSTDGELRVEFGNHGWRYWVNENQAPSRRGYIAIRHGLPVPTFFLESSSIGGATVRNALSMAVGLAGAVALDGEGGYVRSAVDDFKAQAKRAPGLGGHNFAAWAAKEDLAAVHDCCVGDAVPLLLELTKSFDVEVREGWLFAHSYYGEVVTRDPEIWAWVFSVASRMCDLVETWGAASDAAHRTSAFFTRELVPRPKKLDGVLGAILPKRDSKLGTFLFGRGPA